MVPPDLEEAAAANPLEARVARTLRASGIARIGSLRLAGLAVRPWVARWRASLRPMAIGRKILVVPENNGLAGRGAVPLRGRPFSWGGPPRGRRRALPLDDRNPRRLTCLDSSPR